MLSVEVSQAGPAWRRTVLQGYTGGEYPALSHVLAMNRNLLPTVLSLKPQ